jgi:hypothetical protein
MSQNDSASGEGLSEVELGEATIVFEDPDEGTREVTVQNEQIVYAQDHWAFMSGQDDEGNDMVRRIPRDRVHYVERNVQQFEEEVKTVRHRVESIADEVRQKLPMGDGKRRQGSRARQATEPRTRSETIPVEEPNEERPGSSESANR